MKKCIALFSFTLLVCSLAWGQTPVRMTKNQSDCIGAHLIQDTVFGPVLSPIGWGHRLEIDGYALGNPYFFEKEHNSVWYKIKPGFDATLTFDIIPVNKDDDFDFLLFKNPSPNFCENLRNGEEKPVRTNISRSSSGVEGRTGLASGASENFVPAGPGSPFSASIEVKKGETYILVVDNPFRANEGHTIHLHYKRKKKKQRVRPDENPVVEVVKQDIQIKVVDSETGEPLTANITILGAVNEEASFTGKSEVTFSGVQYKSYTIRCEQEGYMFKNQSITMYKRDDLSAEVKMVKLKAGVSISLNNIKFVGDRSDILPSSNKSLEQLLEFMKANPNISIEIQGHVNAPGMKNKGKYKTLSKQRAEAVMHYLINNGIDRSRMVAKGYGNSKMIYPNPTGQMQSEANRRVEIKVLST